MATVDELIVQIKADTRDLDRKLNQLERNVGKASNSKGMRGLGASLTALRGPALGAAAAIAGIGAISIPIVRTGAALEDMKTSLNTVFGSAKAGQKQFDNILKFATESPFQVTDLTQAFIQLGAAGIQPTEKMMRTFAGAASVTTDSLGAFQALVRITQRSASGGLGLEELNQLSDRGIPVFEILAQKLGVTRDQITEMGKSAEGAAIIMENLNEGLEERFGDAVAAKMDTLNQKFSNLQTSFQNISAAMFNEGGLGTAMKTIVGTITDAINRLATLVRMAGSGMSSEFLAATSDEERIEVLKKEISDLEDRKAKAKRAGNLPTEIKERQRLIAILEQSIITTEKETQATIDKAKADAEATAQRKEKRLEDEAFQDELKSLSKLIQRSKPEAEVLAAQIQRIQDILATGKDEDLLTLLGGENADVALARLRERLEELKDPIEETAKLFDENMVQAIVNTSNAFTNDFVNALLSGKSVLESFKNFAKNIVSQIIATFLQLAVVNRILNAVFSGFSGFTPLPTIGGTAGPETQAAFVARHGGNAAASGGRIGGPTLVGERGPEIFIPNSGGRVMNNHSSRMAMGGDGIVINQNLNFSTGVVPTVRQEIMKMLPTISDVTKASVLEAASRGGTYRRGLLGG